MTHSNAEAALTISSGLLLTIQNSVICSNYFEASHITKEYGEANNIKVVLDARNSQTILYADPAYEITDKLLEFVNAKYEGVK